MADTSPNDVAQIKYLVGSVPILFSIAVMLFGIFIAQVYFYWFTYVNDAIGLKALVISLLILECFHTSLILHTLQWVFVNQMGNPDAIWEIVWSTPASIAAEISIIALTEGYYIYRLWIFSNKKISVIMLPTIILLARIASAIAAVDLMAASGTWSAFGTDTTSKGMLLLGQISGVALDVCITGLLTYYLLKDKSVRFRSTYHIIQKILFYVITTCSLASGASIVILLLMALVPHSLLFGGIIEMLSKIYANSVLASLNARNSIREQAMSSERSNSIPLNTRNSHGGNQHGVQVDVYKTTTIDHSSSIAADSPRETPYDEEVPKSDYAFKV